MNTKQAYQVNSPVAVSCPQSIGTPRYSRKIARSTTMSIASAVQARKPRPQGTSHAKREELVVTNES
jgi:hypothetical protein